MFIHTFFTAQDVERVAPSTPVGGRRLTRSGMALSVSQLYQTIMQGKSSTAIVDQPGRHYYDNDDGVFPPDERELATSTQFVAEQSAKMREKTQDFVKALADTESDVKEKVARPSMTVRKPKST